MNVSKWSNDQAQLRRDSEHGPREGSRQIEVAIRRSLSDLLGHMPVVILMALILANYPRAGQENGATILVLP